MAREVMEAIGSHEDCHLASVWVKSTNPALGRDMSVLTGGEARHVIASDDLDAVIAAGDVVVDFTLADATDEIIAAVRAAKKPLVCGVSGLTPESRQALQEAGAHVPVLYDRNMSLGIAVLERLLRDAVAMLPDDFAAEIHETHHVHKKDAPSGTALKLGEALADARGQDFASVAHYDPSATPMPPEAGAIEFFVTREGEVPGDHTVVFANEFERLELTHRVAHRRVFADGALRAAVCVSARPAGYYEMKDLFSQDDG